MKHCARFLAAAAVVCLATNTWAVNSVVIESKSVALGATGVTLGAYVTNDVGILNLMLPLEIRELTPGSFTTTVFSLTVQGRVAASGLMDLPVLNYYDAPVANSCSGPVSHTWQTPTAIGFTSPDAVVWAGARIFGPALPAGTDGSPGSGTPSILLTFDVTGIDGYFEIDSCCVAPTNHLMFTDVSYQQIIPSFTKSIVTIGNPPPPNNPPIAICQPVDVETDPGLCERATVDPTLLDGGSYDPDGDAMMFRLNPLGPYSHGANLVWLVVTDEPGDSDSCQTTITVEDHEPPTAICPSDITVELPFGGTGEFVSFIIDVNDNCPAAAVSASPASGSFFPVGTTPVEVTAMDAAGNPDICYFNVTVTAAPPCNERPADVNCDGVVDVLDVVTVVNSAFRGTPEPGRCCATGS